MNYAMLSTGFSSPVRPLTPCSEEEDESISISIGSNLWESILINTNSESIGHDKMRNVVTISTKFDSSLPKNMNLLCPPKLPREERFRFTQGERLRAKNAVEPSNLEEMTVIVSVNNYLLQVILLITL
jgi:hypothetical protein